MILEFQSSLIKGTNYQKTPLEISVPLPSFGIIGQPADTFCSLRRLSFGAVELNEDYDVYRNLNRGGVSIKARSGKDSGRVIGYAKNIVMKDVDLAVQPSGNQRVRREGRRNVHAFARGTVIETDGDSLFNFDDAVRITYHPKMHSSFVIKETQVPISKADYVFISDEGAYAIGVS